VLASVELVVRPKPGPASAEVGPALGAPLGPAAVVDDGAVPAAAAPAAAPGRPWDAPCGCAGNGAASAPCGCAVDGVAAGSPPVLGHAGPWPLERVDEGAAAGPELVARALRAGAEATAAEASTAWRRATSARAGPDGATQRRTRAVASPVLPRVPPMPRGTERSAMSTPSPCAPRPATALVGRAAASVAPDDAMVVATAVGSG
jgi:hypothetical protein